MKITFQQLYSYKMVRLEILIEENALIQKKSLFIIYNFYIIFFKQFFQLKFLYSFQTIKY